LANAPGKKAFVLKGRRGKKALRRIGENAGGTVALTVETLGSEKERLKEQRAANTSLLIITATERG